MTGSGQNETLDCVCAIGFSDPRAGKTAQAHCLGKLDYARFPYQTGRRFSSVRCSGPLSGARSTRGVSGGSVIFWTFQPPRRAASDQRRRRGFHHPCRRLRLSLARRPEREPTYMSRKPRANCLTSLAEKSARLEELPFRKVCYLIRARSLRAWRTNRCSNSPNTNWHELGGLARCACPPASGSPQILMGRGVGLFGLVTVAAEARGEEERA